MQDAFHYYFLGSVVVNGVYEYIQRYFVDFLRYFVTL